MNREEVLEKIQDILREEFEDDELVVTNETTAADVEEWDSLAHLSIINEIEVAYKFKFKMGEIQELKNVGELVDVVLKNINK